MSKQTRRESFVEALVGTAIGFCVAFAGNAWIHYYYNMEMSTSQNVGITLFFTGVSIIRSYLVRRFFEGRRNANT